jgi:hypothetical protein
MHRKAITAGEAFELISTELDFSKFLSVGESGTLPPGGKYELLLRETVSLRSKPRAIARSIPKPMTIILASI